MCQGGWGRSRQGRLPYIRCRMTGVANLRGGVLLENEPWRINPWQQGGVGDERAPSCPHEVLQGEGISTQLGISTHLTFAGEAGGPLPATVTRWRSRRVRASFPLHRCLLQPSAAPLLGSATSLFTPCSMTHLQPLGMRTSCSKGHAPRTTASRSRLRWDGCHKGWTRSGRLYGGSRSRNLPPDPCVFPPLSLALSLRLPLPQPPAILAL